jgi:NADPH:quinone reductase-like Zn-dependent oxidoreductase
MTHDTQAAGAGRTATMRAALQQRYGPPEVVTVGEIDRPTPKDDEILVRVEAASVNRADLDALGPRPGFVRPFIGLRAPRDPSMGIDAAGVVESVGTGVTRFTPGDRVFADVFGSGQGAFAEYLSASQDAFQRIPDDMSFEDAATIPHSGVLAVQGLRRRNGRTVQPGDKVLIDGASGNVGPFAVQIAKALGAEVTGVCSTAKVDFVRSLGADHVLDYTAVDYTRSGKRYDWILDTDSHHPIRRARRALRPNGVYVTLGGTAWPIIQAMVFGSLLSLGSDRWSGLMLWWKPFKPEDVASVTRLIAEGKVKPVIDRRFPLSEIVDALRWVNDGHAKGKVVITDHPGR